MKCIIPTVNIKVFGRCIHSLSKIGEDLFISPVDEGLRLKTVNSSKAAFLSFLLCPTFFSYYDPHEVPTQWDEGTQLKISMKSIMVAFRSLPSVDRSVQSFEITLETDNLIIRFTCKYNVMKTFKLPLSDSEAMKAIYDKSTYPIVITSPSKLLCDSAINFQARQDELTFCVSKDKVIIKNHVDDAPDITKLVITELALHSSEFDVYTVGIDSEVTFSLKELKALLYFCEFTQLPVSIYMDHPGQPVIFSVLSPQIFEVELVLATINDPNDDTYEDTQCTLTPGTHLGSEPVNGTTSKAIEVTTHTSYSNRHSNDGNNTSVNCNDISKHLVDKRNNMSSINSPTTNNTADVTINNNKTSTAHISIADVMNSETTPSDQFLFDLPELNNSLTEEEINQPNKKPCYDIFKGYSYGRRGGKSIAGVNVILASDSDASDED